MNGLTKEAITSLAAGDSIEDEFDVASTADLAQGGKITLNSQGFVPLVKNGKVTGFIPFKSNSLDVDVDGPKAAKITKAISHSLLSRTKLDNCSGDNKSALEKALTNAKKLASQAADAAESGDDAKFKEYFMTTDESTRKTVAERLRAVAEEAGSTSGGSTTYHCEDSLGYCEPNVLAYTLPSKNIIANCDIYYSELPPLAEECHAQDQATTSLHEFTHAPGVYEPGTEDLGYGYDAATKLSAKDALNNADSYALYANGELTSVRFSSVGRAMTNSGDSYRAQVLNAHCTYHGWINWIEVSGRRSECISRNSLANMIHGIIIVTIPFG